jgi:uncharacterized membrane protein SirB2
LSLYWTLKYLHVSAVVASGSLFLLRGAWMLRGSEMLQRHWVRTVPHMVDTVLLAAALGLLWLLQLNPLAHGWLTAKLVALAGYIVSGSVAIKRGRTRRARVVALAVAIGLFLYMVGTALTRDPAFLLSR